MDGHSPERLLRRSLSISPEERMEEIIEGFENKDGNEVVRREFDGVRAVFEGRSDEAIGIFKKLEEDHPGRYSTAANLGTAYELHGDLELALKWIEEGIRRNPDSHQGSEWLHEVILKARMKLRDDPGFLNHGHLITLPESVSGDSVITVDGHELQASQILDALLYQLGERMVFVKPQDPVVADLLFTHGVLEANTRFLESGIKLLELSREYGFRDRALLDRTTESYERIIRRAKLKPRLWAVAGCVAFLGFLAFARRKKWFFLSRSDRRDFEDSLRQRG